MNEKKVVGEGKILTDCQNILKLIRGVEHTNVGWMNGFFFSQFGWLAKYIRLHVQTDNCTITQLVLSERDLRF